MIADKLFTTSFVKHLQQEFAQALPYRHVVIDDFLDKVAAEQLAANFPAIAEMKTRYNGLNEKKAEHSDLNRLSPAFEELKKALFSPAFALQIEALTGITGLSAINDRYGFGLHQGGQGSFLDIHIDYNLHPVEKKQRRLNLLIFLNEEWTERWGGMLQLWNADVTECITSIQPVFNRCVIFECSEISYHGYNTIICPADITRKSFYTYYFSEPVKDLVFHDTVFKALPQDSLQKKLKVRFKESAKNNIKRMLYRTGLLKFLK